MNPAELYKVGHKRNCQNYAGPKNDGDLGGTADPRLRHWITSGSVGKGKTIQLQICNSNFKL